MWLQGEAALIIEWLPAALRDFDSIIDFIAADNPGAAIEQGDEIEEQVASLLQHRQLGRVGRLRGTRELIIARTPYIDNSPQPPLILRGGALATVFTQKVPPLGLRGGQEGLRDSAFQLDYTDERRC